MNVNKTLKGVCSVCLSAFLVFPMASIPSVFAEPSGVCGVSGAESEVTWNVESGKLTISGNGKMADYSLSQKAPWSGQANDITSILIKDAEDGETGVESIGDYAFYDLDKVTEVNINISSSVKKIGVNAFNAKCGTEINGLRYVDKWLVGVDEDNTGEIAIEDDKVGIADFENANLKVSTIVLPGSIKYIGKNFLKGSSLKSVYFNGTKKALDKLDTSEASEDVKIYYMIISRTDFNIENRNETSEYHVDERPTFVATLSGGNSMLTMEEKWLGSDGTEITKDNNNKFKKDVSYKYVITLKATDEKFKFADGISIDGKDLLVTSDSSTSGSPLAKGVFTFRDAFKALISIDSAEISESKNFDVSCTAVGSKPQFAKNVDSGVNYSMVYQLWEKVNSSGDVEKRAATEGYTSAGSEVGTLESFEGSSSYKYTVCLKPNEGYYFNPQLTAKLCGKDAKVTIKEDGSAVITSEILGTKHSFPLNEKTRVEPTCTTSGKKEHYQCPKCNNIFGDKDANEPLTEDEIELPKGSHEFKKVEATEPTCTKKGNKEYFKCEKCGAYFKSENGQPGEEITDLSSVEIDMIPHTFDVKTFISDGENGHYHKCKYCDAHSETVAHTFGEAWSSDSESHYHKCKDCDYKKDVTKHTFDKKVEDKKYLKDGLTCGDVISYYKSCECGESSKGTESEETFENEEGKKVEHEFGKDGVCTICSKTNYKVDAVNGSTYTETEDGSLVFRANGSIDKLSSVKVDGTVLTEDKDYTVKSGSTIVELKNDYLKTLSEGEHKLTIVYEDGECEAKFSVKADDSKSDDDPENDDNNGSKGDIISDIIYKTGDNAGLISLVSTMLTSGLASVWFAKKRRKNR